MGPSFWEPRAERPVLLQSDREQRCAELRLPLVPAPRLPGSSLPSSRSPMMEGLGFPAWLWGSTGVGVSGDRCPTPALAAALGTARLRSRGCAKSYGVRARIWGDGAALGGTEVL